MTCLELKGVSKRYDGAVQDALHALDLEIEEGEILGVVGASGSGKTTLLRLVAGLESPTTGELRISGLKVAGGGAWVPPEKRGVGLVFQEGALFPHMTVEANVAYGLRGLSKEERMARLHYLLAIVNLRAAALRYPHELSGGERQRIALARALAPNPKMVLLDEPFSNLDPNLRTYLRDQLLAIIRKVNATALVVTHDTQDALVISDRLAILRDGQLVQHGPSRDVYHTPNDAYCARLFGPANALPEAWSGVAVGKGRPWIRPRELELLEEEAPGTLEVQVHATQFLGDQLGVLVYPIGVDRAHEEPLLVHEDLCGHLHEVGATRWIRLRSIV